MPLSRQDGRYGYIDVAIPEGSSTRAATWQAGAELNLLHHAFRDDAAVQKIVAEDVHRTNVRDFIARNLPPGADSGFHFDAQGRVTFHQRYHLLSGTVVVLRGERISLETLPSPH